MVTALGTGSLDGNGVGDKLDALVWETDPRYGSWYQRRFNNVICTIIIIGTVVAYGKADYNHYRSNGDKNGTK